MTRSWTPHGPQIFRYNMCENVSKQPKTLNLPLYTHCKLWKLCSMCISWPSLTPVYLPWGGVNRLLDMQGLRNQGSCVIKRCLSNACLSHVQHFTCTLYQLLPLVIISPLHNHKQEISAQFEGIFKLEKFQ